MFNYIYSMYSKEFIKETKTLFYTSFGVFMRKHKSLESKKIKWVNYPTYVKNIFLRIHADTKVARVQIDFQQKDPEIRSLFFEQFKELKNIFHSTQNEEWNWEENYTSEIGIEWSRVYIELENVNIYNKENWQEIFEFFEGKLLKFDEFWNEFFELFKQLED